MSLPDAAPVVLQVFNPVGSLVVLRKNMEVGVRDANTCVSLRQLAWSGTVLLWSARCCWPGPRFASKRSTLAIRAVHQGTTMPDGFRSGITRRSWHSLSKVSPQKRHSVNYI